MSNKKNHANDWAVGIDWAHDTKLDAFKVTKVASKPASMADTIICDQKVKEQIEEALRGDQMKLLDEGERRALAPPGIQEVTIPVKVITVPGMDLSKALLVNPSQMSNMFSTPEYNAMYGLPNKNGDAYSFQALEKATDKWRSQHAVPFYSYQLPAHAVANIGAMSMGAISRWGPRVRADINERCEVCENSLICNTYDVCPVVCVDCKRRFIMHRDVEVSTSQVCLGFDWKKIEEAKKDCRCSACSEDHVMCEFSTP